MKKIDSMNLVPFIDIMLVLLVIVLTTASFVNTSRIQVSVPKVSDGSSKQDTQSKPITIAIDEQGRYYLNDKPHTLESLKEAIKSYDESTSVIINGDSQSNLNAFVQMMDIIQAQGLKDLYIVVEEE